MIYLMQLNYVMPVLDYICSRARKIDQSLSMHFVKKVLEMTKGPYSRKFIEGMGDMISEIVEVVKKTDTEPVVRGWIGKVKTWSFAHLSFSFRLFFINIYVALE